MKKVPLKVYNGAGAGVQGVGASTFRVVQGDLGVSENWEYLIWGSL